MTIINRWKPLISIIGIILIMMTAASVCAEDPLERETQAPDDTSILDAQNGTEGNTEPLLIMTGDSNTTNDLPDYENYTGDMLISPGPNANAKTTTPLTIPLLGIIGAVIAIVVVMIGILIKRKNK